MTTPTPLERLAEIAREDRRDGEAAFYSHEGEKLIGIADTIDWAIARIAELEEAQAQLAAVLDEIAASEQHGDDADDPDCPICKMHAALRTALEGKPHE